MAINYNEGLKRLKQVIGTFWLALAILGITLLGLLFLVANILAVLFSSGAVPWAKIAAAFSVMILLGGIGYFATITFAGTVIWIIKGFTS